MKKRGLSQVVTTVLLILIVLTAVSVIWAFVRPTIEKTSEQIGIEFITINMEIVDETVSITENTVDFKVKRNAGAGNVVGLKVVLEDIEDNEKLFDIADFIIEELESKDVFIDYSGNGLAELRRISIAPVFENEVVGNIVDVYEVLGVLGGDGNGGDVEEGHNFQFLFADDGFLEELNWTSNEGATWRRISWDEEAWAAENDVDTWHKIYLHSRTGIGFTPPNTGWKYILGSGWPVPPEGEFIEEMHSQITYTKLFEDDNEVRVSAETDTLRINDTITFDQDTMYISINITNKLTENIVVRVPVHLGGLQIDDDSRFRLRSTKGGHISEFSADGGGNLVSSSYPLSIGSYSPVGVLWDNEITIGEQYLTELYLPTYVQLMEKLNDRHSERLKSVITTELEAGKSKTFVIAFKISDGSGQWKNSLQPYKDWFDLTYGNTPNYCPTGPSASGFSTNLAIALGLFNHGPYTASGGPIPWHNTSFDPLRWYPGSTLNQIYIGRGILNNSIDIELETYGILASALWPGYLNQTCYESLTCERTCLGECMEPVNWCGCTWNNSTCINNCAAVNCNCDSDCGGSLVCAHSANAEIFDPNLDVGADDTKLTEFANTFRDEGTNLNIYMRTCSNIYDAEVNFLPNGSYEFVQGPYVKYIDLRDENVKNIQFDKYRFFVEHNITDFYIDFITCPGEYEFIDFMKQELKSMTGEESFILREGGVDRTALQVPQALILQSGDKNHSNLLFWLLPDATYYEGKFSSGFFNSAEIDGLIEMGYQPFLSSDLVSTNPETIQEWKDWSCGGYVNRVERWNNYGQSLNCAVPQQPSYC